MQHPFAGMLPPEGEGQAAPEQRQSRRSTVARIIGGLGSLGCLVWGRSSQAAQEPDLKVTTLAVGEEGGVRPPGPPRPTTQAVGEEGGGQPPQPPKPTTKAVGEEGGGQPPQPPKPSTQAVGEEGGGIPKPSTKAFGEEGGTITPASPARSSGVGDPLIQLFYGDPFLD